MIYLPYRELSWSAAVADGPSEIFAESWKISELFPPKLYIFEGQK